MTWFTPERSFEGVGLRVGDVLTGISTYGHSGTIGADRLLRAGTDGSDASAQPSDYCRAAIDTWNPSLVH
jgi:hypothetical protein